MINTDNIKINRTFIETAGETAYVINTDNIRINRTFIETAREWGFINKIFAF